MPKYLRGALSCDVVSSANLMSLSYKTLSGHSKPGGLGMFFLASRLLNHLGSECQRQPPSSSMSQRHRVQMDVELCRFHRDFSNSWEAISKAMSLFSCQARISSAFMCAIATAAFHDVARRLAAALRTGSRTCGPIRLLTKGGGASDSYVSRRTSLMTNAEGSKGSLSHQIPSTKQPL